MAKALFAANDFDHVFTLEDTNEETGAVEAVTDGEVAGTITTAKDSDTPADEALTMECVHIGVAEPTEDQYAEGTWLAHLDADALTFALLDPLFADRASKPWLIITSDSGARLALPLTYRRIRRASAR